MHTRPPFYTPGTWAAGTPEDAQALAGAAIPLPPVPTAPDLARALSAISRAMDGTAGVMVDAPSGPLGCALAMRVMQSGLFAQLDEAERADCDEPVRQNREWFRQDAPGVSGPAGQTFPRQTPMD